MLITLEGKMLLVSIGFFVLNAAFLFLASSMFGLFEIHYERAMIISLAIILIFFLAIAGSIVSYKKCGNIFFCGRNTEEVKCL